MDGIRTTNHLIVSLFSMVSLRINSIYHVSDHGTFNQFQMFCDHYSLAWPRLFSLLFFFLLFWPHFVLNLFSRQLLTQDIKLLYLSSWPNSYLYIDSRDILYYSFSLTTLPCTGHTFYKINYVAWEKKNQKLSTNFWVNFSAWGYNYEDTSNLLLYIQIFYEFLPSIFQIFLFIEKLWFFRSIQIN
jgi:hypothetical protein